MGRLGTYIVPVLLLLLLQLLGPQAQLSPRVERRVPRERKKPEQGARNRPVRRNIVDEEYREPFTIKKAHEELGWVDPADKHEELKLFGKYVEAAYNKAAMENGFEEVHMRTKNLPSFLTHIFDADRRGLFDQEHRLILSKVSELCRMEGLVDPEQVLLHGYLGGGKVFTFLKETFDEMRDTRRVLRTAGDWAMHRDSIGL